MGSRSRRLPQTALHRRGIAFTSPERSDQIARRRAKGSRGGRKPALDQATYTGRNMVEDQGAR
ncbi:hypothetical protein GCM10010464_49760 [Pseudonocardia yunnanensis]